jgi:hypothetical protein
MVSCQTAKKQVSFLPSPPKDPGALPYFKCSRALIAAQDLKCEKAIEAITTRIKQLEYGMEFIRDLSTLYENGPSKEIRGRVGKQIAGVEKLRWYVSYSGRVEELRIKYPELDADIKAAAEARREGYRRENEG